MIESDNLVLSVMRELRADIASLKSAVDTGFDKLGKRLRTVEHHVTGLRHDEAGTAEEITQMRDDLDALVAKFKELEERTNH